MPLPLPNLDDRRWADLVEEGRALIPLYAPEWSDHNASDPGITLVELFAWLAEMGIYQLNQIPAANRKKFLKLVGIEPKPPRPARTVLTFVLTNGTTAAYLPTGTEAEGVDPFGQTTRFRTRQDLNVVPARLRTLQSNDGRNFTDLTRLYGQGKPIPVFGDDPRPGAAFYVGLDTSLPVQQPVTFYLMFNENAGEEERQKVIEQAQHRCCASDTLTSCANALPAPKQHAPSVLPAHHCVRTVWEFRAGENWRTLSVSRGEVMDDTRSFTLDGAVIIKLPANIVPSKLGWDDQELFYVRCRFVAGVYDVAPRLKRLDLNAVPARQAVAPDLPVTFYLDGNTRQGEQLGMGTASPFQQVLTSQHPVVQSSLQLFTVTNGNAEQWLLCPDFDASKPEDRHFLFDPTSGAITFGSGDKGRVVPQGALIVANYLATRAEAGNAASGTINRTAAARVKVTNHLDATDGAAAETLPEAAARAVKLLNSPTRAVTLKDYEWFAQNTPGTHIARVAAKANVHPAFPYLSAPGVTTVCVLPSLPADRPMPSSGLLRAVSAHLRSKRVLGSRVEVCGPTYFEVTVQARIRARRGTSSVSLQQRITAALDTFFHPINGGPQKAGWPFGREVYRSEVMVVIDQTEGVDHVISLTLLAGDGIPQCGNICVGLMGLVASGPHRIEVVS